VTLPRESGRPAGPATPLGPPLTRSTSAARTRVTTDPIRSFSFLRRRMIGALGPPRAAGLGTRPPAPPPSLRVPAGRPGPARARPPGDPRLDRRCPGSPGRLGVPGAPGSGGQRHRGPGLLVVGTTLAADRSPEASRSTGVGHHRLLGLAPGQVVQRSSRRPLRKRFRWWACQDLNLGPHPYQGSAPGLVAPGFHLPPAPRRTAGDRYEPLGADGLWTKRGPGPECSAVGGHESGATRLWG
jgi:hypothetical protein